MQKWTVESQEIILWFNCSKIQFNFRMKWNETWQLSPVPGPVFKGYSLSFIYLKQFNSREHQTTTMVKQSQRTITTGSSSAASWTELNWPGSRLRRGTCDCRCGLSTCQSSVGAAGFVALLSRSLIHDVSSLPTSLRLKNKLPQSATQRNFAPFLDPACLPDPNPT